MITFCLHNTAGVVVFCIFIIMLHGLKQVLGQSCEESSLTLKSVLSCPRNLNEWQEAADEKNCSSFNQTCVDPERFVYHCVINEFINETLEVCAVRRNLIDGFCAEYNTIAQRVQVNLQADCKNFTVPCPELYFSTDTYKYQECYNLTIQATKKDDEKTTLLGNVTKKVVLNEKSAEDWMTILARSLAFAAITLWIMFMCLLINSIRQKRTLNRKELKKNATVEMEMFLDHSLGAEEHGCIHIPET